MSRVDIAVVLRLVDQLTVPIQKSNKSLVEFNRTLTQLGKAATATTKSLTQLSIASAKLTATLSESAGSMKAIGASATTAARSLTKMSTATNGLASEAGKVQTSFGSTFAQIGAGTSAAIANTRALATQWRGVAKSVATAGRAVKAAGAVSARTQAAARVAGGGRGGGAHISSFSAPLPGGIHGRFHAGGNAGMAALGAIGYGIFEESQFEDAAFRAMFTAGIPSDKNVAAARVAQLRNLVQNATAETGKPIVDVENAVLTGIRQFAGLPWAKRLELLPELLRAAAAESSLKGTTVQEGMEVFTGLAHMVKHYNLDQIKKDIPKFAYLSTVDPEAITRMQRASSYAVPILQSGLEVDPFDTMLLVTALQRSGIVNSKSGTWIREAAIRAMPGTSVMSKTAFKKHEGALKAVGLIDDRNNPTWFSSGKPDLIKMLDLLSTNLPKIPLTERAGIERQLFGAQGAGAAAVLSDKAVIVQVHNLRTEMDKFRVGESFFEQYGKNSPVQQFNVAWADFRNVLMDVATIVLPPLTGALGAFDETLKTIQKVLPGGGSWDFAKTVGHAYGRGLATGNPIEAIGSGVWAAAKYGWTDGDQQKAVPEHSAHVDALNNLAQTASAKSIGATLLDDLKAALNYINPIGSAHAAGRDNLGIAKLAMPTATIVPGPMAAPIPYLNMGDKAADAGHKSGAAFTGSFLDMVLPSIRSADVPQPDGVAGAGRAAGKTWSDSFMEQVRTIIGTAKLEGPAVKKPASAPAPSAGQQPITHVHVGGVTIHVDGANDPKQTADAVEDRFHRATWRGLWDGQFQDA